MCQENLGEDGFSPGCAQGLAWAHSPEPDSDALITGQQPACSKSFVFMKKKGIVDILDKSKLMESVTCIKIYKSKYI